MSTAQADLIFESLVCVGCDRDDAPDTRTAAETEGWVKINSDDGMWWTHVGTCPDCRQNEIDEHQNCVAKWREQKQQERKDRYAKNEHPTSRYYSVSVIENSDGETGGRTVVSRCLKWTLRKVIRRLHKQGYSRYSMYVFKSP